MNMLYESLPQMCVESNGKNLDRETGDAGLMKICVRLSEDRRLVILQQRAMPLRTQRMPLCASSHSSSVLLCNWIVVESKQEHDELRFHWFLTFNPLKCTSLSVPYHSITRFSLSGFLLVILLGFIAASPFSFLSSWLTYMVSSLKISSARA